MRKTSALVVALLLQTTEGAKIQKQDVQKLAQQSEQHCGVCDVIAKSIQMPYNPPVQHHELQSIAQEMENPKSTAGVSLWSLQHQLSQNLAQTSEPWGTPHSSTGAAIPICNGANAGNCTEADEVVKHRIRRPFKRAAPGDPDYVEDVPVGPGINNGSLALAQNNEPWGHPHSSTGPAIPICNGANAGNCTEASEVVKHRIRRPFKRAAPGDPDYVEDVPVGPGVNNTIFSLAQHTEPWGHPHSSTGPAIPICNGANAGNCTEASEVVKHRIRRPFKRAAPGDPDYVDEVPEPPAIPGDLVPIALVQMPWGSPHPSTGDAIAICNGGNDGHCVEAAEVVKHRLRRPGKMPGRGDPDDPDVIAAKEKKLLEKELKGAKKGAKEEPSEGATKEESKEEAKEEKKADAPAKEEKKAADAPAKEEKKAAKAPAKKEKIAAAAQQWSESFDEDEKFILVNDHDFVQTESQVILRDAITGKPMAWIPNSMNFAQQQNDGLIYNEGADFNGAQKAKIGLIDEDPTGMTSDYLMIHAREPWGSPHGEGTGEAIAICNGMNSNHCTEAADLARHRLRRPGKRAAVGDPDYVDDDEGVLVQKTLTPAQLAQVKNSEPVSTESGASDKLNERIKKAIGFEDDGGITSDMNLMTDEQHFTGNRISICNGMNGPSCVEPIEVFQKQRREGYQALPGDLDYPVEEKQPEFPSYLSQKGKQGTPIKHYSEYVKENMNQELLEKILNSDYDDKGLTEDVEGEQSWVQTAHWGSHY